jgi:hypothetical protein
MRRQTYEDMVAVWPQSSSDFAAPMNEIPKIVFSKTLGARRLAGVADRGGGARR